MQPVVVLRVNAVTRRSTRSKVDHRAVELKRN
jgi:hypothetical protein